MDQLKDLLANLNKEIPNPFILIYKENEELEIDDVQLIETVITNNQSGHISLIISGDGGHFSPAIDVAVLLREKFDHIDSYIPAQASSAFAYVILISDSAFCCNQQPLSQFDLIFTKNGDYHRARTELNSKNIEICEDAKYTWRTSSEILKNICQRHNSLYNKREVKDIEIGKIMNLCMRDSDHEKSIRLSALKKVGFNIELCKGDLAKQIMLIHTQAILILKKENKRFFVGDSINLFKY
jgi:hypothetical protein